MLETRCVALICSDFITPVIAVLPLVNRAQRFQLLLPGKSVHVSVCLLKALLGHQVVALTARYWTARPVRQQNCLRARCHECHEYQAPSVVLQAFLLEKLNLYDQIVAKSMKRRKMDIKQILHEFPSERWFTNGICTLLKWNYARGSAFTICIRLYDLYGTNTAHEQ